jgi:hypothetical protein
MTDEIRNALISAFGEGATKQVYINHTVAKIEDNFEADDSVSNLVKVACSKGTQNEAKLAGLGPVGENGKPRMLKITAWICHADKVNNNRFMLTAADLQAAVDDGLFSAPYFGMLDFNHDFRSWGVWYSAKYAYDSVAGAYGIIAEGVLFAWAFEWLADKMLAMQERNGHIDVSVAVFTDLLETAEDEKGQYVVLHRPVIAATSVLDETPADPFGRGIGTEEDSDVSDDRELQLAVSAAGNDLTVETPEEEIMDEKTLELLVAAFSGVVAEENQKQFAPLIEAAQRLVMVEKELETATAALALTEEKVKTLTGEVEQFRTASEQDKLVLETANSNLETAATELEELRQFKASVEADKLAAESAKVRDERMGQLSEVARANLAKLDTEAQERLASRWEKLDEDEWKLTLSSLNGTVGRYEAASYRQGELPTFGSHLGGGEFEIDKYVK